MYPTFHVHDPYEPGDRLRGPCMNQGISFELRGQLLYQKLPGLAQHVREQSEKTENRNWVS